VLSVKHLIMLRDLAEHGTVAAVAELHSLTVSSVSKNLRVLEAESEARCCGAQVATHAKLRPSPVPPRAAATLSRGGTSSRQRPASQGHPMASFDRPPASVGSSTTPEARRRLRR
jgi:hypothetical protein